MLNLLTEVKEGGKVNYFRKEREGIIPISHQEYINLSLSYADQIYEKVVEMAMKNGCIYCDWVQRNFQVNWYVASHIIDKMRDEGLCGKYDSKFGASKLLVN